ncbi:unnamed protein product [Protopolystoma xenopodis]|uniref:Uncharacterized protein n=1 Tax=Protopolystoma xenopodis TaxID=117903 RepID=A0A3S5AGK2_9PLAT|nr:unnamed protein product [Protopolystoma xenopodis]
MTRLQHCLGSFIVQQSHLRLEDMLPVARNRLDRGYQHRRVRKSPRSAVQAVSDVPEYEPASRPVSRRDRLSWLSTHSCGKVTQTTQGIWPRHVSQPAIAKVSQSPRPMRSSPSPRDSNELTCELQQNTHQEEFGLTSRPDRLSEPEYETDELDLRLVACLQLDRLWRSIRKYGACTFRI